jgi:UDP:flavonoid glycosyltransferase YjiC (YdhE family)
MCYSMDAPTGIGAARQDRDKTLTVTSEPLDFDIVVVADMARTNDVPLRIRRELQVLRRAGYRCGLRHVPSKDGQFIAPELQRSVAEGLGQPIPADRAVSARLAIVHSPAQYRSLPGDLSAIRAERVVFVVDQPPQPEQMGVWFSFALGPMTLAPTNRWARERLQSMALPLPVTREDWRAIAAPCGSRPAEAPGRMRPVVGRVGTVSRMQWPKDEAEIAALHPTDGHFDVWLHGKPPSDLVDGCPSKGDWTVVSPDGMSTERFLEAIDALLVFTSSTSSDIPDTAIAAVIASGKPVVMSPHLEPHLGPAALYAEPAEAEAALARFLDDAASAGEALRAAREHSGLLFSPEAFLDRIAALIGPAVEAPPGPALARNAPRRPRALFVPSNGIGVGHATRLLAIARRMETKVEPVFASLGQASSIIEAFGYAAEYIPSYTDIGAAIGDWDAWFRPQLREMIDRHDADVVVFDGNHPTTGLVEAALADGRRRLVWVRRGMCAPKPSPYLGNARFFDCIIEPGELAGDRDTGPTSLLRHEVQAVPPIRLLDADELLSREAARVEMGLDPARPAVLLQLGAGGNRDVVELTDRLLGDLRRFDGLQIVIAEWSNGAISLPLWSGTRRLRGFPISRLFNGFDFSISAAGYNTYHEVIAFGLPTIFVANRHPSMDDQGARAAFAQDHGAGFDLTNDEMHIFPTLCRAMLTPQANAAIRANCAAFEAENGASAAAEIITRLAGVT